MKCSWASLNLQAGSRRFPALTPGSPQAESKPRTWLLSPLATLLNDTQEDIQRR